LEKLIDPYGLKENETEIIPQVPGIPENMEKIKSPDPLLKELPGTSLDEKEKSGEPEKKNIEEYDVDFEDSNDEFEISFSDMPIPGLNVNATEFSPSGGNVILGVTIKRCLKRILVHKMCQVKVKTLEFLCLYLYLDTKVPKMFRWRHPLLNNLLILNRLILCNILSLNLLICP